MKKLLRVSVLLIALMFVIIAGASAPEKTNAWILLPETKIMTEPDDSSSVLYLCKQNDEVILIGDPVEDSNGVSWQKVNYNDTIEGYVRSNFLYYTSQSTTEQLRRVKISPEKMGELVPLYKVLGSEPVLELSDGAKVVLLETTADYGDYSLVEYDGEHYFVMTKYITDTLTYNQKIAIIIAVAIVGIVISAIVILLLFRKKNLNK